MSFSSGFKDGFSYYTALADRRDEEKLTESRLQTESLRQESLRESLAATREERSLLSLTETDLPKLDTGEVDVSKLSLRQREQLSKTKASEFNFNEIQPKLLEEADLKLKSATVKYKTDQATYDELLKSIDSQEDKKAVTRVIDTQRLLSEGKINPEVAASFLEEDLLTLRDNLDFTKFVSEDYMLGWQRIAPKLETGDLESIAREDKDVLTKIFSERLQLFKGKDFVSKDGRRGIIQDVSFSGDFDSINQSRNLLVGGNYKVLFEGDTEATEVFSYLPDNARAAKEIREDIAGDDAKVVSVADVVDKVAAEKDFAMFAINNPQVLETYKYAAKGAISFEGPRKDIKNQVETYFKIKKEGETRVGNVFKNAETARSGSDAMDGGESAYLESLYKQETNLASKYIQVEQDEFGDTVYSLKEGLDLGSFQDDLVKKYADPSTLSAQVANAYAEFGNLSELADGRKPFYLYEGEVFRLDTPKDEVNVALRRKITNFDAVKQTASQAFESVYGYGLDDDKVTDEMYLAFMTEYLNKLQ